MIEGLDHTVIQHSLWIPYRIVRDLINLLVIVLIPAQFTVPGPVSGLSATPGVIQLTISWSPQPQSPMEPSLHMKCVLTAVECSATPTHQPHSSY